MAEVLSQSQIDALLNSLQGGEGEASDEARTEEKQYRKYDFYSPKKFTKDKLKIVKSIFDSYARIAASQINSLLRTSSEVRVAAVEEQRYYEFINALHDNDVMALVDVTVPGSSKNPPLLTHTSQNLMLCMIDRILGGTGQYSDVDNNYTYTGIEMALYKRMIRYLVAILGDAWGSYIKLLFELQRLEENPSMFQEIGMDEIIVIVVLDVEMTEAEGKINFCIPGNLLMNIFAIIDSRKHSALEDQDGGKDTKATIMRSISRSTLEVTARLEPAQLDLEDIYGLRAGDVINLGQPKESPITLCVEGQPWFTGLMGVHKRNVAVKIEDRIKDEATLS